MYPRGLCAGARAGYAVLVREIRVQVKLSNFADPSRRATAEMLVDTGATRVSLPSGLVRRLGLRKVAETQVEYADDRRARVPVVAPLRIAIDGRAAVTEVAGHDRPRSATVGQPVFPPAASTRPIASTSSRTCAAEVSSAFFSSAPSAISITRSTPPAPICTGTPT